MPNSSYSFIQATGYLGRLYLWTTVLLFVTGTINLVFQTFNTFHQTILYFEGATSESIPPALLEWLTTSVSLKTVLLAICQFLFLISKYVHQCSVVWDSRKILYLLAFLVFITNVFGLVITIFNTYFDTNLRLLLKWVVAQDIYEGYFLQLAVNLGDYWRSQKSDGGIAPALIIVRAHYGKELRGITAATHVSDIQFNSAPAASHTEENGLYIASYRDQSQRDEGVPKPGTVEV
ncbi:hypothetical protein L218DRAFT_951663 [Marasmius fiardii PR-910]|nr:hypothetical protein L218DRAFT_951663 [Marasmius fiardii PR-910]